jgi:chorismate-pyruvate lyase
MSVSTAPLTVTAPGTRAVLADLCRPFARGAFEPDCVAVQPENIPFPEDDLLVHHDHMTIVLQRHHGSAVQVHVLEEHLDGDLYTRKIALTPAGSNKIVEWGIVRLNFKYMPSAVREEILGKQMPLGAILVKHDVHRRIKPRYFLQLPEASSIVGLFDAKNSDPLYGRIGTIYCDDEPCIEVLEIVLNTK